MRLLIDASSASGLGSGGTRVAELMAELPECCGDHHITLAVPRGHGRPGRVVGAPIDVITPPRWASRPAARIGWQLTALPALTAARRCDAVLGMFNVVSPWWSPAAPRVAVMVSNLLPFHADLGVSVPLRMTPRLAVLKRLTLAGVARADLVIVQSRFAAQVLAPVLRDRPCMIVGHRPPDPSLAGRERLGPGGPYLLVVADRFRYKGIHVVIDALARLAPAERPTLAVVGRPVDPAYERRLRRAIERDGLAGRVNWLGHRSRSDVMALMGDAVACVASSHLENLSRIPGEAMAMGAPLICSDIPPHREAAGDAALYYPPSDAGVLAGHIARLVTDHGERAVLIARGHRRVRSCHAPPATSSILSALEGLLS
ncbi:MAG: glycosyltransferase [Solirubrobacteraceae bacterium]